jgi:hypothetical protein
MKWGRRKAKTPEQHRKETSNMYKSPAKLLKNFDKISDKNLERAVGRLTLQQKLRTLSNENRQKGSKYINSYVAYGTTMATAYGLYKSPLGQKIKEIMMKRVESGG